MAFAPYTTLKDYITDHNYFSVRKYIVGCFDKSDNEQY
jgi:hypothetical protein